MRRMWSAFKNVLAFQQLAREQRRVVFYCEGRNYWVHLHGILAEFLAQNDVGVCYVSSSADDPGLKFQHPNLKHFLIDEGAIRNWFFQNLDTDLCVMTMPDLHQYQVKRSARTKHYAYIQHSLVSLHMIYRPGAFDHFDSIFCAGPHHIAEIRRMEELGGLPPKQTIEHGYSRIDTILKNRPAPRTVPNTPPHVLIAPSWGENGLIERCGTEVVNVLINAGLRVTLRPHPQTRKFSGKLLESITHTHAQNPLFAIESNVAGLDSLYDSDVMISDWSGAALEYALGLEKPVVFVDVPRKVNNPDYLALAIEPLEAHIRERIGGICAEDALAQLPDLIAQALATHQADRLQHIRADIVYHAGNSDSVGAQALRTILNAVSLLHER